MSRKEIKLKSGSTIYFLEYSSRKIVWEGMTADYIWPHIPEVSREEYEAWEKEQEDDNGGL